MELTLEEKLLRLESCRRSRNLAAQTCIHTFQQILKTPHKVSELYFKNKWLKELEKSYIRGFIDCWYEPPPDGITVLFGRENDYERANYSNLRPEKYWPRKDIFLSKDGLGYIFASSYTMIEGIPIIGDFGFTFYLGTSQKIKDHFRKCYRVLQKLFDDIKLGMTFSELYEQSIRIIEDNKLKNNIIAVTDKAGTDLGHTIPFIDRNPDEVEMNELNMGKPEKINNIISMARIFINNLDKYQISENCAFTFEPRFISKEKKLPMFSLHTIIQFVEGKKIIVDYFKGIFNLLGMNWLYT